MVKYKIPIYRLHKHTKNAGFNATTCYIIIDKSEFSILSYTKFTYLTSNNNNDNNNNDYNTKIYFIKKVEHKVMMPSRRQIKVKMD